MPSRRSCSSRWFEACSIYDELLGKDRNDTVLRDAYRRCLRRYRQARRLADEARADADLALAKAHLARAEASNQELQKSGDTLRQEIKRGPGA